MRAPFLCKCTALLWARRREACTTQVSTGVKLWWEQVWLKFRLNLAGDVINLLHKAATPFLEPSERAQWELLENSPGDLRWSDYLLLQIPAPASLSDTEMFLFHYHEQPTISTPTCILTRWVSFEIYSVAKVHSNLNAINNAAQAHSLLQSKLIPGLPGNRQCSPCEGRKVHCPLGPPKGLFQHQGTS